MNKIPTYKVFTFARWKYTVLLNIGLLAFMGMQMATMIPSNYARADVPIAKPAASVPKPGTASKSRSVPETQRQKIYWELRGAQWKAFKEATALYPDSRNIFDRLGSTNSKVQQNAFEEYKRTALRRATMADKLEDKYEGRVMKKFHLTPQVTSDILLEGAGKDWPLPQRDKPP